jgi:hypothetical protein
VLALEPPIQTGRLAVDLSLLAKFTTFCKAMKVEPHLDLTFHGPLSPATVRIPCLAGFYGVVMPRQLAYDTPIPDWLQPPQPDESRVIRLHDLDGVDTFTGTDDDGCVWSQFQVDALAEQESGSCSICGATLHSGWHCLDGGEEVCDSHVQFITSEVASGNCSPSEEPVAIPA